MILLDVRFWQVNANVMSKFDEITIENIFGEPVKIKGKIIEYKQYGYNLKSGAWGKYKINDTDEPAKFIIFKPYRKRKKIAINVNRLITNK